MTEAQRSTLERFPGETEVDWLTRRLCGDPQKRLLNIGVTWGLDATSISPDERAAAINRVLDQVAAGDFTEVPPDAIE